MPSGWKTRNTTIISDFYGLGLMSDGSRRTGATRESDITKDAVYNFGSAPFAPNTNIFVIIPNYCSCVFKVFIILFRLLSHDCVLHYKRFQNESGSSRRRPLIIN